MRSLYRKSAPNRSACAPDWRERLSATSYSRLSRPVGPPESVPNDATPAMLTAGPMDRKAALEAAVGELAARLVDGARRQRRDIARRDRLVDVVEAGRSGRRIQH